MKCSCVQGHTSLKLLRLTPSKGLFELLGTGQLLDTLLWESPHPVHLHIHHKFKHLWSRSSRAATAENFEQAAVVFQETSSGISALGCGTDLSFVTGRTLLSPSPQVQMSYKSILWLLRADKRRFMYCTTIPLPLNSNRRFFKGSLLLCDTTTALPNRTDDLQW